MWLKTQWKLRRALRRYRRDGNLDAVLHEDWSRCRDIFAFFHEIEDRLHGEEITRLRQKQAEYLALQNQINPHFLYNALEAIRSDALLADCEDIAETTEALATFFRYTISNVQEYVTFSDELDNAENYFTIQRCRFGDKLDMELEMENEDLLEARMPKLILQPLAENSVMHGSSDDGSVMEIHITCWEEDGHMILELQDDGKGFEITRTDLNPHKDRKKIGVANVNDRIQLNFGREYGLKIDSHPCEGTTCTLTLPKLYADTLSQQPEE